MIFLLFAHVFLLRNPSKECPSNIESCFFWHVWFWQVTNTLALSETVQTKQENYFTGLIAPRSWKS